MNLNSARPRFIVLNASGSSDGELHSKLRRTFSARSHGGKGLAPYPLGEHGTVVLHSISKPGANDRMRRYCLSLQLRPDPVLVAEYIRLHEDVWPEIRRSIYDAGVLDMQIYRSGTQLFMIMDTTDDFTLESKAALDSANPKVIEWETLMSRFQQVDEAGDPTRRWVALEKIFQLT